MKKSMMFLLLGLILAPIACAQQHYTITDLGPVSPTDINTWGQVVGNYNGHAYIWTKHEGWQDLGTIAGGTFSQANAISDAGTVVGVGDGPGTVISTSPYLPNEDCSNLIQPFVWTQANGMFGLGSVAYAGEAREWSWGDWCSVPYYATDSNIFGQVVGSNREAGTYKWGFLWTSANGMAFFADAWQTSANGINNLGQVVGQTGEWGLSQTSHAALWDEKGKTDLGTLSGTDPNWASCSAANSISDSIQVVGWSTPSTSLAGPCWWQPVVHAFLWTQGAGMQDLGTLPGDTESIATRVNYFGQVVGSSGSSLTYDQDQNTLLVSGKPFIWSEHAGMRDLNDLIGPNSLWVLQIATGINDSGQIVGTGTRNGEPHGFLLTPRGRSDY